MGMGKSCEPGSTSSLESADKTIGPKNENKERRGVLRLRRRLR